MVEMELSYTRKRKHQKINPMKSNILILFLISLMTILPADTSQEEELALHHFMQQMEDYIPPVLMQYVMQ